MNKLIELYQNVSKHSNYQVLPEILKTILDESSIKINSRFEKERMNFVLKYVDFTGANVLDIGGNTGFFSFESIENGANSVTYYDGNGIHSEFVKEASYQLHKNIYVFNEYVDFKKEINNSPFDIVYLFNVIHHLGDDYGDTMITMEEAKLKMKEEINYLTKHTEILILQMGFCWKGNRNLLLFENGTKSEMIEFIKDCINENWDILGVGVPEVKNEITSYEPLNESNIIRDDSIGEFRNRPIFILRAKK